jgi:hypothetical protein
MWDRPAPSRLLRNEGGTVRELRLCRLQDAAGRVEHCPGGACPFWEPGGAVLEGRCAIEQIDLHANADIVHRLVELRSSLVTAPISGLPADVGAKRLFHRLTTSGIREFPDPRAEITAARFSAGPDAASRRRGDSGASS